MNRSSAAYGICLLLLALVASTYLDELRIAVRANKGSEEALRQ